MGLIPISPFTTRCAKCVMYLICVCNEMESHIMISMSHANMIVDSVTKSGDLKQ